MLEAVEEAIAARIIEEPAGTIGRYQFTHALIQETLSQELSSTRRARLHARIAQALETLYGANAKGHAAELAKHFAEAELVLGHTELVRYALLAGEQALASYAYEDATTHFERGLAAREISLSGAEMASDGEAADLLFGLARAWSATAVGHQLEEAFANLSRAFDYHVEAGNAAQAVAVAEFPIVTPGYGMPGVAGLLARALTLVPADSHDAGRLLSSYGGFLGISEGDYEGAQQALGRAMDIARREGDGPLEVQTLAYAANVSAQQLYRKESVIYGLRAIELDTGDGNPVPQRICRWWTAWSLLHMGDLEAARPHALVLLEIRSTSRMHTSNGLAPITFLSCFKGDWKAGREYSGRGLEVSPQNPNLLFARILLEHETGDSAQGQVYLERLLDAMHGSGPYRLLASNRVPLAIAVIARITGLPDRLDLAETVVEANRSGYSATPALAMNARAGSAMLTVRKGGQSAAAEHYDYFLQLRGSMILTALSADRLLGLLSQTLGNLDQAMTHFEDALAFCLAGYRPELAWTGCDYADALRERNGPGDRAKAKALLDESLAISTALGMRPLMERVTERLELIQAQPYPPPAYPVGLSQREVEVLRLIAAGKTDREIARELFISFRTVGNHVSNILNKTNTSNRTEAATFAAHQGLT